LQVWIFHGWLLLMGILYLNTTGYLVIETRLRPKTDKDNGST
jgi:hypothetical protein